VTLLYLLVAYTAHFKTCALLPKTPLPSITYHLRSVNSTKDTYKQTARSWIYSSRQTHTTRRPP
jgi:hypothetical protein